MNAQSQMLNPVMPVSFSSPMDEAFARFMASLEQPANELDELMDALTPAGTDGLAQACGALAL